MPLFHPGRTTLRLHRRLLALQRLLAGRRISRSGCVYDRVRPGLYERFFGAIVSGTYDGFFVIDTHVDLETLWGRSARELRDQLRTAQVLQRRGIHLKRNRLPLAVYGSMFPIR